MKNKKVIEQLYQKNFSGYKIDSIEQLRAVNKSEKRNLKRILFGTGIVSSILFFMHSLKTGIVKVTIMKLLSTIVLTATIGATSYIIYTQYETDSDAPKKVEEITSLQLKKEKQVTSSNMKEVSQFIPKVGVLQFRINTSVTQKNIFAVKISNAINKQMGKNYSKVVNKSIKTKMVLTGSIDGYGKNNYLVTIKLLDNKSLLIDGITKIVPKEANLEAICVTDAKNLINKNIKQ